MANNDNSDLILVMLKDLKEDVKDRFDKIDEKLDTFVTKEMCNHSTSNCSMKTQLQISKFANNSLIEICKIVGAAGGIGTIIYAIVTMI